MAQPRRSSLPLVVLLALGGAGGYAFWTHTEKDRTIAAQRRVIADLARKLDRAWADELVADVRVNAVAKEATTGDPVMDVTFIQYKPGTETPAIVRDLRLRGEELYIDALVAKFDRQFVEVGDALRGKSVILFRRAFGDRQRPVDGVPLFRTDGSSPIPEALQVDEVPSEFERELWASFWQVASDPTLARARGVRTAHGEAPHVKAVAGQVYKVTVRASGGIELTPRLPGAVLLREAGATKPTPGATKPDDRP